jgi:hypothetical protein
MCKTFRAFCENLTNGKIFGVRFITTVGLNILVCWTIVTWFAKFAWWLIINTCTYFIWLFAAHSATLRLLWQKLYCSISGLLWSCLSPVTRKVRVQKCSIWKCISGCGAHRPSYRLSAGLMRSLLSDAEVKSGQSFPLSSPASFHDTLLHRGFYFKSQTYYTFNLQISICRHCTVHLAN